MRTSILLFLVAVLVVNLAPTSSAVAQFGRWDNEGEGDLERGIREGRFRPNIEVSYGIAQPRFEGLGTDFKSLGLVELKLGFRELDRPRGGVVAVDERFAFGSYFSDDLGSFGDDKVGDINSKLGRFGFGNRLGYGYGWKAVSLELYNQNSLNWTQLEAVDYDSLSTESQEVFDRYGQQLRFGQLVEAGAQFQIASSLALAVSAEGAVVFPRHVFWPWLGSAAIYSAAQGGIQYFSELIVESSPLFGPALFFILKSGVSLGYYLAMQGDMNWPFDSETPVTVESLKLNATIVF